MKGRRSEDGKQRSEGIEQILKPFTLCPMFYAHQRLDHLTIQPIITLDLEPNIQGYNNIRRKPIPEVSYGKTRDYDIWRPLVS